MALGPTLGIEDELPLPEPPDVPNWSENYCLQAYDARTGHGFWLHMGLPVYDAGLWHDITIVYLPGGEDLLVAKSFAPRAGHHLPGPIGAMLQGEYEAQGGDWTWRFHGAAHLVKRSELHRSLMPETIAQPARFELRFSGLSRVWDLTPDVGGQVWAAHGAHWEQPCRCVGWLEYQGRRIPFDGTGIRDHSRGTRDTTHFGPHFWLHGQFPGGRSFGLLHVAASEGQPRTLSRAFVVRDGVLSDAQVLGLPGDRAFSRPFEILLKDERGEQRITGELLHDMTFSFFAPNEILMGRDLARAERFLNEGQVRWTWDGEVGYGLAERTVKLGADRHPDLASVTPFVMPVSPGEVK